MADHVLDAKGLNCPLPILKAKKMLRQLSPNETLEVFATDPGSTADFLAFTRATGHSLLEHDESDGAYRFLIRKKA